MRFSSINIHKKPKIPLAEPLREKAGLQIGNVNKFHTESPRKNAEKKTGFGFARRVEYA